ncbi:putative capsular polysaccharide synthesis family protein [Psychromonas sp.]|uniref:putative capsular polysaccharide synthesis family protein n=1 Tax=Psychromonas sp. TaxID=1884585 RepID=UPI0039E3CFBE
MFKKLLKSIKYYFAMYKRFADENNVLIYQMGKVGSTSLEHAIENAIHIHTLYLDNHTCKPRQAALFGCGFRYYYHKLKQAFINHLRRKAIKSRDDIKVVTLVRKPMKRNISMYFHDLDAYIFNSQSDLLSLSPALMTRLPSENLLITLFEQQFDHHYPLTWFDKEIKRFLGIDVYKAHFDKNRGYMNIKHKNIQILCIDAERLTEHLPIVEDFIGKKIILCNKNKAENKWYAPLYQQFNTTYQPSDNLVNLLENSKFNEFFFVDNRQ